MSPDRLLSIVIPLKNEAPSLKYLHFQVVTVMQEMGCRYEMLFVDDGSIDDSQEILAQIVKDHPHCCVIRFRRFYGKGAAYLAGFFEAKGDYVVTLDADLQDDPVNIPRLIGCLEAGSDFVQGRRINRQDTGTRKLTSLFFNWALRGASGVKLHDFNCGLRAMRSSVAKSLVMTSNSYRYVALLASARGARVTELDVIHRPRIHGQTKYGPSRYFSAAIDFISVSIMTRFFDRPMYFFAGLAVVASLSSFLAPIRAAIAIGVGTAAIAVGLGAEFALFSRGADFARSLYPVEFILRSVPIDANGRA